MEKQKMSMLDWLRSEEGKSSMREYAKKLGIKEDIKNQRCEKVNLLNNENFSELMSHIINTNDESWKNKCHKVFRCQPHPTNLLYLVMDASIIYGEDVSHEFKDISFPVSAMKYRDYTFFWMFGQGCHNRVYHNGNPVIWL